ncbi:MAG: CCA tRNA nucleotidyltransferase [Thermoleophilia bacterium]|nr:CCA tRNA nucleotidyltransferase [Thermoleophilia bacterium]
MLQTVADILRRRQTQGWLVGGSVRDSRLGRCSPDLDIVVADEPAGFAAELAGELRAPWFPLSERHGAYRVMGRDGRVDVAALRGGDILADMAERDFTINAMAVPVDGDGLIDPFDGASDLQQGRLVAVSERIFADDPLRLMRAARFCHLLGLRPDTALTWALQDQAPLLSRAASERVAAEMVSTLEGGRSVDVLRLWNDLGLLRVVLPELSTPGRLAPTVVMLERLDDLLARVGIWFPAAAGLLGERLARPVDGAVTRPVALRLAGLMHRLSAEEAQAAARRLKLSTDLGSLLRTVAKLNSPSDGRDPRGTLSAGPVGSPEGPVGHAAVLFLWEAAPWEPEVICVLAAAGPAPEGEGGEESGAVLRRARGLMALWGDRESHGVPRPPLDGDAIMRELGLSGGPLLGRVLREVRLAWEAGEATTYSQAVAVARSALAADQAPAS